MNLNEFLNQKRSNFLIFLKEILLNDEKPDKKMQELINHYDSANNSQFLIYIKTFVKPHKTDLKKYISDTFKKHSDRKLSRKNRNKILLYLEMFIDLC